jgi:hypothetical protein
MECPRDVNNSQIKEFGIRWRICRSCSIWRPDQGVLIRLCALTTAGTFSEGCLVWPEMFARFSGTYPFPLPPSQGISQEFLMASLILSPRILLTGLMRKWAFRTYRTSLGIIRAFDSRTEGGGADRNCCTGHCLNRKGVSGVYYKAHRDQASPACAKQEGREVFKTT